MRIYVLYLDVYFLENVLLNLVLLIFTLILTGRRIRFIRLLSASLIGGMMAILPIILRLRYGIAYILLILLTGLLVITIASGMRSMSEQWTAMLHFYVMSFVWNRLFTGLERILGTKYTLCAAIVTAIMGTVSGYLYERKQIVKKQTIYDVEVAQQGRKLTLKALLDTGNGLREPISGRPVSIIERDVYDTLCHQTIQERYRVIPYHSIGKEHVWYRELNELQTVYDTHNNPYAEPTRTLYKKFPCMQAVTFAVTYFRDLRIYINSMEDSTSVQNVTYGMTIPKEYRSEVLADIYASKGIA